MMQRCFGELVGAWAVGSTGVTYAENEGFLLGGEYKVYELQMHYLKVLF